MNGRVSLPTRDSFLLDSRLQAGPSGEICLLGTAGRNTADSRDSEVPVNIALLPPSDCSVIYGEILSGEVAPHHVTRQVHCVGIWGGTGSPLACS